MKIGKIELTQEKLIIAALAVVITAALAAYLIFYVPLMSKLKTRYLECCSIERDVIDMRDTIEGAGKLYGERILCAEEEINSIIDELTTRGRGLEGLNFLSIKPKEIKKEKDAEYKIMPIEMKTESSYEQLGIFLGSLDEMEKGLVKVKSFDISASVTKSGRVVADLVIEVYISGREL